MPFSWYTVLVIVCAYMAITCGIVADRLYRDFRPILSWFAASVLLGFVLLGAYALQHAF